MNGKNRLQKACDACNIRKVKCDEGGPPCQSCLALDTPCTYDRPKKRRGPPNKHAEAIKKQKAKTSSGNQPKSEPSASYPPISALPPAPNLAATPVTSTTSLPALNPAAAPSTDPSSAAATGLLNLDARMPSNQLGSLSGESICPLPILQLLVDDYFLFIHPLIPVPHEPTFREAFARREDLHNGRFLALLAAAIGSLVASFPRRPRLHLRADPALAGSFYSNSMALAKRCHDIAVQARGLGYLDTSTTVEDAAISYHLSLCSSYVYNHQRSRMYLGECMTILRVYTLYKPSRQGAADVRLKALGSPVSEHQNRLDFLNETTENFLIQEQGRRLLYVCLAGLQTLHQLGSADGRTYIPPETPTNRYPPLPLEVDDEYITANYIAPQPVGVVSQMTGFNANVRIFQCYSQLLALEISFHDSELVSWERQRQMIWESLQKAKRITAELPPELSLNYPQTTPELSSASILRNDWPSNFGGDVTNRDRERRKIQYEIQKVNIYISQLSTRSYLVEKYWTLFEGHIRFQKEKGKLVDEMSMDAQLARDDSHPPPDSEIHAQIDQIGQMMRLERELVIKDLLCLLQSVQEIHIEPNGASFTNKVRQVASTLLNLPQDMSTISPAATATPADVTTGTPAAMTTAATSPTGPQSLSTSDAEKYLRTFLSILVRLEGVGITGDDPMQSVNTISDTLNIKPEDLNNNINNINNLDPAMQNTNTLLDGMVTAPSAAPISAPSVVINNNNGGSRRNSIVMPALLNDPMVSAAAAAYPSPNYNEAFLLPMTYTGDGVDTQEEEEMRQWTNLKEFQKSFAEVGGWSYST